MFPFLHWFKRLTVKLLLVFLYSGKIHSTHSRLKYKLRVSRISSRVVKYMSPYVFCFQIFAAHLSRPFSLAKCQGGRIYDVCHSLETTVSSAARWSESQIATETDLQPSVYLVYCLKLRVNFWCRSSVLQFLKWALAKGESSKIWAAEIATAAPRLMLCSPGAYLPSKLLVGTKWSSARFLTSRFSYVFSNKLYECITLLYETLP